MTGDTMRRVLNDTGCYLLTGSTSADWEITACAAGLDHLEGEADALLADLFAQTASSEQLDRWERLYRPQSSAGPAGDRRTMLLCRQAVNPGKFCLSAMNGSLPAAGLAGLVQEEKGGLRVLVGRLLGVTKEEACRELDQLLPTHLGWTWDDSVTWTALDNLLPAFGVLDGKELSWTEFDSLTRQELETLGTSPAAQETQEETEKEEG